MKRKICLMTFVAAGCPFWGQAMQPFGDHSLSFFYGRDSILLDVAVPDVMKSARHDFLSASIVASSAADASGVITLEFGGVAATRDMVSHLRSRLDGAST